MAEPEVMAGQQILPLIDHLARLGHRAVDSSLSGWLRIRHFIALRILDSGGPVSQHALGTALSLDPSNVVSLLNELEDRGLVERRRDPADRRRHIVSLSAAGKTELAQAYKQLGLVEDELFSALSASERATFYELLVRAVGSATPPCEASPSACAAPSCEAAGSEASEPLA